jgi:hypothetical protein
MHSQLCTLYANVLGPVRKTRKLLKGSEMRFAPAPSSTIDAD